MAGVPNVMGRNHRRAHTAPSASGSASSMSSAASDVHEPSTQPTHFHSAASKSNKNVC